MKKLLVIALSAASLFAYEFAISKQADINVTKSYVANIYSKNKVMIATRLMGFIKKMPVEEGDIVKKGQLLFEVDPSDINSMLSQAQGALIQAKSGLLMAEMEYTNALRDYYRFKALYSKGAVSKRTFQNITLIKNIRKEQINMAKGMLKQAQAALNRVKAQYKYAKVVSPINGIVTKKFKKVGDMALPGYPILIISDLNSLRAKSFVNASEINNFRLGMPVKIYVPSLNKTYKAKISTIIPSANPLTHTFVIKYSFKNTKGLIPGMYAKAKIVIGKKKAILVPFAALTTREGLVGVFVDNNGYAKFIPIKQIGQVGSNIAVKGLKGGEKVILYPPANLVDGQKL